MIAVTAATNTTPVENKREGLYICMVAVRMSLSNDVHAVFILLYLQGVTKKDII